MGNLDLDFEIWTLDFAIKREIQKQISPLRNPSSGWISIKKSKSRFHGFPFYRSIGTSGKRFAKLYSWTAVFFLLIMRTHSRPLFVRTVFSNPWKDIQKQISQGLNPFSDFTFECKFKIQILKSTTRFPNQTAFTFFYHYFRDNASYSDTYRI